jgi:hypothetical protein
VNIATAPEKGISAQIKLNNPVLNLHATYLIECLYSDVHFAERYLAQDLQVRVPGTTLEMSSSVSRELQ